MKYLLDTHTFLWSLFESSKLSKSVSEIIINNKNDIYVSTISFWEISLKYSIGKLTLKNVMPEELPDYAKKSGFEITNIDETIASSFHKLPKYEHSDPFDRLLIWQAINMEMIFITKDSKFDSYLNDGLKILWK
jgi:PIN domain nuclease of toxin-antitoxin system